MTTEQALDWLRTAAPELEFLPTAKRLSASRFAFRVKFNTAAGGRAMFGVECGGPDDMPDAELLKTELEFLRRSVKRRQENAQGAVEVMG